MKLLVDTHVWIWMATDPGKLSSSVLRKLEDPRNELWFSPLSVFELLELQRKNRLEKISVNDDWIAESRTKFEFREAPMTAEVALETRTFRLPHGDPIDALLVATARVFKLTLVTADEKIGDSAPVPVLAAR